MYISMGYYWYGNSVLSPTDIRFLSHNVAWHCFFLGVCLISLWGIPCWIHVLLSLWVTADIMQQINYSRCEHFCWTGGEKQAITINETFNVVKHTKKITIVYSLNIYEPHKFNSNTFWYFRALLCYYEIMYLW